MHIQDFRQFRTEASKRRQPGWSGTSSADRTRKAGARESRPTRRFKATQSRTPGVNPIKNDITQIFPFLQVK